MFLLGRSPGWNCVAAAVFSNSAALESSSVSGCALDDDFLPVISSHDGSQMLES